MREYFEAEMRLLKEAAQEFAEKYPEQARMLNLQALPDRDPYIERLLEGVAFLTAQIRQKIDDDIPEISESLLMQLWPHLLRPFPSATIMQFTARPGQLQNTHEIAKGTVLQSNPVGDDQHVCKFRTTTQVKLNPLQIHSIDIVPAKTCGTLIRLDLQTEAGVAIDKLDLSDLRLYLHADPTLATELHYALTATVQKLQITLPKISLETQLNIQTSFLEPDDTLIPTSGRSFHGFHLLHEYFLLREKYLFISILGLEKIHWPQKCQQFTLEIHTKHLFADDYPIKKNMFRLHCVPAINLFDKTSEPIKLTHKQYQYPVIADVQNPQGTLLYSINQVIGTEMATGKRLIYQSLHTFRHNKENNNYYHLTQQHNRFYITPNNDSTDTIDLSCSITCSNGYYPRKFLQENQITPNTKHIQGNNITRPTPMYLPPKRSDYRWTLISHLALNYHSLTDIHALQQLLSTYDWSKRKENQQHIASIEAISIETVNQIRQGALTQGIKFNLKINEENFSATADIHLFGLILHHFFSMYASINTLVTTHVTCHPSNKEFTWEPLPGASCLI